LQTQRTLSSTEGSLQETKKNLADTESKLEQAKKDLAQETSDKETILAELEKKKSALLVFHKTLQVGIKIKFLEFSFFFLYHLIHFEYLLFLRGFQDKMEAKKKAEEEEAKRQAQRKAAELARISAQTPDEKRSFLSKILNPNRPSVAEQMKALEEKSSNNIGKVQQHADSKASSSSSSSTSSVPNIEPAYAPTDIICNA
jgi:phage-related minor tail protein